jgi:hypothetical protein
VPLCLYFVTRFLKFNTKDKVLFALTTIAGFTIPFLPFLFGDHSFLNHPEYNPFIVQFCQSKAWESCQINVWFAVLGVIILVYASFKWQRMKDLFFLSGLFLFALILAVGIRSGIRFGWHSVIFDPVFDKSYFSICIPFFLFYIHEMKKKTLNF